MSKVRGGVVVFVALYARSSWAGWTCTEATISGHPVSSCSFSDGGGDTLPASCDLNTNYNRKWNYARDLDGTSGASFSTIMSAFAGQVNGRWNGDYTLAGACTEAKERLDGMRAGYDLPGTSSILNIWRMDDLHRDHLSWIHWKSSTPNMRRVWAGIFAVEREGYSAVDLWFRHSSKSSAEITVLGVSAWFVDSGVQASASTCFNSLKQDPFSWPDACNVLDDPSKAILPYTASWRDTSGRRGSWSSEAPSATPWEGDKTKSPWTGTAADVYLAPYTP